MFRFIVKRLLEIIPILLIVSILIFLFVHMIPGDPARLVAGEDATLADVEMVRKELGLDKPIVEQYVTYMKNLFKGDMGNSLKTNRPVSEEIGERFMPTFWLTVWSMVWAVIVRFSDWCNFGNKKK